MVLTSGDFNNGLTSVVGIWNTYRSPILLLYDDLGILSGMPSCPRTLPFPRVLKNPFHLSVFTVRCYFIMNYGMKDVSGIFQFPFIAESGKKFSAK